MLNNKAVFSGMRTGMMLLSGVVIEVLGHCSPTILNQVAAESSQTLTRLSSKCIQMKFRVEKRLYFDSSIVDVISTSSDNTARIRYKHVQSSNSRTTRQFEQVVRWSKTRSMPYQDTSTSGVCAIHADRFYVASVKSSDLGELAMTAAFNGRETRISEAQYILSTHATNKAGRVVAGRHFDSLLPWTVADAYMRSVENRRYRNARVVEDTTDTIRYEYPGYYKMELSTRFPGLKRKVVRITRGMPTYVECYEAPVSVGGIYLPTRVSKMRYDPCGEPTSEYRVYLEYCEIPLRQFDELLRFSLPIKSGGTNIDGLLMQEKR